MLLSDQRAETRRARRAAVRWCMAGKTPARVVRATRRTESSWPPRTTRRRIPRLASTARGKPLQPRSNRRCTNRCDDRGRRASNDQSSRPMTQRDGYAPNATRPFRRPFPVGSAGREAMRPPRARRRASGMAATVPAPPRRAEARRRAESPGTGTKPCGDA